MTEHDPVEAAIREVERLSSESGKTTPVEHHSVVDLADEILQPKPEVLTEIVPMSTLEPRFSLITACAGRSGDIDRKRTNAFAGQSGGSESTGHLSWASLQSRDDGPVLTKDGYRSDRMSEGTSGCDFDRLCVGFMAVTLRTPADR